MCCTEVTSTRTAGLSSVLITPSHPSKLGFIVVSKVESAGSNCIKLRVNLYKVYTQFGQSEPGSCFDIIDTNLVPFGNKCLSLLFVHPDGVKYGWADFDYHQAKRNLDHSIPLVWNRRQLQAIAPGCCHPISFFKFSFGEGGPVFSTFHIHS